MTATKGIMNFTANTATVINASNIVATLANAPEITVPVSASWNTVSTSAVATDAASSCIRNFNSSSSGEMILCSNTIVVLNASTSLTIVAQLFKNVVQYPGSALLVVNNTMSHSTAASAVTLYAVSGSWPPLPGNITAVVSMNRLAVSGSVGSVTVIACVGCNNWYHYSMANSLSIVFNTINVNVTSLNNAVIAQWCSDCTDLDALIIQTNSMDVVTTSIATAAQVTLYTAAATGSGSDPNRVYIDNNVIRCVGAKTLSVQMYYGCRATCVTIPQHVISVTNNILFANTTDTCTVTACNPVPSSTSVYSNSFTNNTIQVNAGKSATVALLGSVYAWSAVNNTVIVENASVSASIVGVSNAAGTVGSNLLFDRTVIFVRSVNSAFISLLSGTLGPLASNSTSFFTLNNTNVTVAQSNGSIVQLLNASATSNVSGTVQMANTMVSMHTTTTVVVSLLRALGHLTQNGSVVVQSTRITSYIAAGITQATIRVISISKSVDITANLSLTATNITIDGAGSVASVAVTLMEIGTVLSNSVLACSNNTVSAVCSNSNSSNQGNAITVNGIVIDSWASLRPLEFVIGNSFECRGSWSMCNVTLLTVNGGFAVDVLVRNNSMQCSSTTNTSVRVTAVRVLGWFNATSIALQDCIFIVALSSSGSYSASSVVGVLASHAKNISALRNTLQLQDEWNASATPSTSISGGALIFISNPNSTSSITAVTVCIQNNSAFLPPRATSPSPSCNVTVVGNAILGVGAALSTSASAVAVGGAAPFALVSIARASNSTFVASNNNYTASVALLSYNGNDAIISVANCTTPKAALYVTYNGSGPVISTSIAQAVVGMVLFNGSGTLQSAPIGSSHSLSVTSSYVSGVFLLGNLSGVAITLRNAVVVPAASNSAVTCGESSRLWNVAVNATGCTVSATSGGNQSSLLRFGSQSSHTNFTFSWVQGSGLLSGPVVAGTRMQSLSNAVIVINQTQLSAPGGLLSLSDSALSIVSNVSVTMWNSSVTNLSSPLVALGSGGQTHNLTITVAGGSVSALWLLHPPLLSLSGAPPSYVAVLNLDSVGVAGFDTLVGLTNMTTFPSLVNVSVQSSCITWNVATQRLVPTATLGVFQSLYTALCTSQYLQGSPCPCHPSNHTISRSVVESTKPVTPSFTGAPSSDVTASNNKRIASVSPSEMFSASKQTNTSPSVRTSTPSLTIHAMGLNSISLFVTGTHSASWCMHPSPHDRVVRGVIVPDGSWTAFSNGDEGTSSINRMLIFKDAFAPSLAAPLIEVVSIVYKKTLGVIPPSSADFRVQLSAQYATYAAVGRRIAIATNARLSVVVTVTARDALHVHFVFDNSSLLRSFTEQHVGFDVPLHSFACFDKQVFEYIPTLKLSVIFAPVTFPVFLPAVTSAATTATTILSFFSGSHTTAAVPSRVSLLVGYSDCAYDSTQNDGFSVVGYRYGARSGQYLRGAVVGNVLLLYGACLGFVLLSLLMGCCVSHVRQISFVNASWMLLDMMHVPSVFLVPLAQTLLPTITASMQLIFVQAGVSDVVLGVLGFGGVGFFVQFFTHFLLQDQPWFIQRRSIVSLEKRLKAYRSAFFWLRGKKSHLRDVLATFLFLMFEAKEHWQLTDEPGAKRVKRRFVMLIEDTRRMWYPVLDLWSSVALALVGGLSPLNNLRICFWQLVITAAVFGVLLVVNIVVRPALSHGGTLYLGLTNGLSLIATAALLANSIQASDSAVSVATIALSILTFVAALVSMVAMLRLLAKVVLSTKRVMAAYAPPKVTCISDSVLDTEEDDGGSEMHRISSFTNPQPISSSTDDSNYQYLRNLLLTRVLEAIDLAEEVTATMQGDHASWIWIDLLSHNEDMEDKEASDGNVRGLDSDAWAQFNLRLRSSSELTRE